jgi:hypothetical protein
VSFVDVSLVEEVLVEETFFVLKVALVEAEVFVFEGVFAVEEETLVGAEGLAFEGVFAVEEEALVEAEATGVEEVLALGGTCLLAGTLAVDVLLVAASSSSRSCLALCLSTRRSAITLTECVCPLMSVKAKTDKLVDSRLGTWACRRF